MYRMFRNMARGYERYMTYRGRSIARDTLLRCDDRVLADNGFSRDLLELGVKAWPWRVEEPETTIMPAAMLRSTRQAIAELEAYSDADLQDLGISRGSIRQSVMAGRVGIEDKTPKKAA